MNAPPPVRVTRRLGLLLLASLPSSISAHHSTAFYAQQTIELEGKITAVAWHNPHVRLRLETVGSDGGAQVFELEGGSVFPLQANGVTAELFRVGDRVKVAGRPSTRDAAMLMATNVLLQDGREVLLWPSPPRFASADRVISRPRQLVDAKSENRGIFRVWSVPSPNVPLAELAKQPFTAAAIAARSAFDLTDNFATRCEGEGMPRIMFNPHPFELIDHGNTITLRTELYDIERTIHMDRIAPPPDEPASRRGYSVGRWEDGQLIVTTTLVDWPYFDNIGTPQTTAVKIAERFVLSDDQSRLDFEVTITDPSTLTAPAVLKGHWLALGDTIARYDCRASQER